MSMLLSSSEENSNMLSLIAALLFTVHPIHVEAVSIISFTIFFELLVKKLEYLNKLASDLKCKRNLFIKTNKIFLQVFIDYS